MDAIDALQSRTSAPWNALVAFGVAGVVKVITASALQQIPADACHVSQLLGRAGQSSLAQDRVAGADERVVRQIRVADQGADS
jgi:hypothetical protein